MTVSPGDGSMRAGNADRERVVAQLNAAFAEGRLDVAELDERVAAAYAAKTLGELVPLTADLPAGQKEPRSRPAPPARREDSAPARREGAGNRWAGVRGSLALFIVCTLIWAVTNIGGDSELSYFWPVWTAIPLVFAVVGAVGQGRSHRGDRG
jgi:uncharacterized membrane protein YccC